MSWYSEVREMGTQQAAVGEEGVSTDHDAFVALQADYCTAYYVGVGYVLDGVAVAHRILNYF